LAVLEHAEQNAHKKHFNKAKILNKEQNYGKRMIKESFEIDKCPANFNREDGWKFSNKWKPIIHNIKRK